MSAEYNSPAKAESAWTWIKENVPSLPKGKTWIPGAWGRGQKLPMKVSMSIRKTPVPSDSPSWEMGDEGLGSLWVLWLFLFPSFGGKLYFWKPLYSKATSLWQGNKVRLKPFVVGVLVVVPTVVLFICWFLMNILIYKCSGGNSWCWDSWKAK